MLLQPRWHNAGSKRSRLSTKTWLLAASILIITFWLLSPSTGERRREQQAEAAEVGPLTKAYVQDGRGAGGREFDPARVFLARAITRRTTPSFSLCP